jgi:cell wall assembly regulator SMI1
MESALIERLDRRLATDRPDYYAQLQPGVTDEALDAFQARFGLVLPGMFRALYKWRNGQRPECLRSLQGNRMFTSLEEIAGSKEELDGMIGLDFEDPRWWRPGWIPFLHNGGGDHLCLDLAAVDGGKPGQLIAFWHDWEVRSVESGSLGEWLSTLVESMDDGTIELI